MIICLLLDSNDIRRQLGTDHYFSTGGGGGGEGGGSHLGK